MKQLAPLLMAPSVIPSSPWQFCPPSKLRPPPDLPPCTLVLCRMKLSPPESPYEALSQPDPSRGTLSPPELPLESLSPPKPPLEALSPPEPPDPPEAPFNLVLLLLFNTSLCCVVLCWCLDWSSHCYFPSSSIMLVIVFVVSTMGCSIPIAIIVSISHPLSQVLSLRFSELMLGDELIPLIKYLGLPRGPSLIVALVRSFTAVCSLFTVLCSFTFVVFKFLCAQLWQPYGLLIHISVYPVNRVLLDVYSSLSSIMEVVLLPYSSSTLCGFVAGNVLLKIRDTSNSEVLIKGFLAMLKIVDCALAAASISEFISLIVVSNFQGFVSLYSLMVTEIRGLLNVISCLSVLYSPILLCCICFLVIVVCLAWMALFTCSLNTFSFYEE